MKQFDRAELDRMWARTPDSCECVHCQSKIAGRLLMAVLDAAEGIWDEGQQCFCCGRFKSEGHNEVCRVGACIEAGLSPSKTQSMSSKTRLEKK